MKKIFRIQEGSWNFDDVGIDGSISSYTQNGSKVSFFVKNGVWKYSGFVNRNRVSGEIPHPFDQAFDTGDEKEWINLLNLYMKKLRIKK